MSVNPPNPPAPPQSNEAYILFSAPINNSTVQALINTVTQYITQGRTALTLLLSTPGGQVDPGIILYNALRALPIRLITYNMGTVDSIGNVIFMAGEERYACTHSRFMFHGVGFDIQGQTMRFEEKGLEERINNIKNDQARISGIIEGRTNLVAGDIEHFFHEAAFLTPTEALTHGIIQDIRNPSVPAGVPFTNLILQG